ncbi:unnamed protein product [marine sediment metagenome]|uniref:Uncharacterized protein n=1 Tax=marine sediment metagenome TaxID=412755 RepID=X1H5Y9_9ZZZZ
MANIEFGAIIINCANIRGIIANMVNIIEVCCASLVDEEIDAAHAIEVANKKYPRMK